VDAREQILAAARGAAVPARDHPGAAGLGVSFDDLPAKFAEMVAAVGGACLRVPDLAAADRAVRALPTHASARQIVSTVPGVGGATVDARAVPDAHELSALDLCVLPGEVGVAENGGVWVDGRALPHPALVVIPEHLVLVLPTGALVPDMHQAYARIGPAVGQGFGLFVAGPSKTADIEQALVIGAHGARSCTVVLVGA